MATTKYSTKVNPKTGKSDAQVIASSNAAVAKAKSVLAQTKAEGSKSYAGSSYEKAYNASIPMTALQTTTVPDVPAPPTTPDFGSVASAPVPTQSTIESGFASNLDWLNSALNTAYNEVGTGEARLAKLEKDNQLKQKQEAVNNATNQLNQIVAKQQQDLISLRATGSQNGVTEAVYGGQQATINREATLAALPVQVQLAAAQNNLEMAQSHIDKMFAIQSQDAQAKYQYKTKVIESLYNYANASQQRQLDRLNLQEQQAFTEKQNNIAYQRYLASQATEYGQGSLAGAIMALDPASPTYQQDLANKASKLYKPVSPTSPKAPTIQNFGTSDAPQWKQYDYATGQWNDVSGVTSPAIAGQTPQSLATTKANVDNIDSLINSGGLNASVGTSFLTRKPEGFWGNLGAAVSVVGIPSVIGGTYKNLTGERQNFIAGVQQMTSGLKLDTLIQAKARGATFGALSDNELKVLAESATKIGTWAQKDKDGNITSYNASEKDFKSELDKINNFAKLDYILKGGDPMDVGVQMQSDGTLWTVNSDGTYTQIK